MSGSEVHEITIESETLNGRTVYRPRCKCGDFEGGTYLHRNGAWRGRKTYRIGPRRYTVSFNGLHWPKVTKG